MNKIFKRANEYCPCCDRDLVPIGAKCSVCGYRNRTKLKKPTSKDLLNKAKDEYGDDNKILKGK